MLQMLVKWRCCEARKTPWISVKWFLSMGSQKWMYGMETSAINWLEPMPLFFLRTWTWKMAFGYTKLLFVGLWIWNMWENHSTRELKQPNLRWISVVKRTHCHASAVIIQITARPKVLWRYWLLNKSDQPHFLGFFCHRHTWFVSLHWITHDILTASFLWGWSKVSGEFCIWHQSKQGKTLNFHELWYGELI